jgi:hypothetical protein
MNHPQGSNLSFLVVAERENCRETVAGEVWYEPSLFVNKRDRWLKNMIQHFRQLLGTFGTMAHKPVSESGKTAQIGEHRTGIQAACRDVIPVVFLDNVRKKVSQYCPG